MTCHSSRKTAVSKARQKCFIENFFISMVVSFVSLLFCYSLNRNQINFVECLLIGCGGKNIQCEKDFISENAGIAFENTIFD